MVVPVRALIRFRPARLVVQVVAAGLLLSGCWGWIPETPAPAGQASEVAPPPAAASEGEGTAQASPSPSASSDWYTVESGDTLFSIAWRYRVRLSDLAAWNMLGDGSLILVGQRIRLTPPPGASSAATATSPGGDRGTEPAASATGAGSRPVVSASPAPSDSPTPASSPAAPARPAGGKGSWQWPSQGRVDSKTSRVKAGDFGIRVMGQRGQDIVAADAGKVMYAGDGLKAYGLLVIVQHTPEWLSAYGHNEKILVREGDEVSAGQAIATMGTGPGNAAMLHFEIRRNGKPVEPIGLLPPRD